MSKKIEELTERLYGINADISLYFVTGLEKPTKQDMVLINRRLGKIIKELREENDKDEK